MNKAKIEFEVVTTFLNGVCRHELNNITNRDKEQFLNGVCRHEHVTPLAPASK